MSVVGYVTHEKPAGVADGFSHLGAHVVVPIPQDDPATGSDPTLRERNPDERRTPGQDGHPGTHVDLTWFRYPDIPALRRLSVVVAK